jgi:Caspase domain
MNRSRLILSLLTAAALGTTARLVDAAAPEAAPGVRLRRFALMIGVNDGGATRARLRYATSDAHSMARVLENLGGVAPADLVFVAEPSRAATLQGFAQVEALMRAGQVPGVRRELLVYYSGHSDEEGLMLGNDRLSYDELRARIKQLPAELRVAILDSCASGAFTRHKGGVRRPPFLVDASADMRGHAFLTSSAANEVAQESDRIAASFFTHFLVSGLRGAADVNQDHRVTLQEAYQFASQETLARTERTRGGPQHAAYEFDLSGTGDMVVTDVRTTQAGLVLTPELSGRITVRESGGALVAELRKPAGNTIELGVEAGSYVIAMEGRGTIFEASATLVSGQRTELGRLAFHPGKPAEIAVARGDAPADADPALAVTGAAALPRERVSTKLEIVPRPSDERTDVTAFSFGLVGDRAARLDGFQLGLGWTQADQRMHGLQLAIGATMAGGDVEGLQLANGVTYAEGRFRGAQLAGLVSLSRGDARGLQISGITSLADGWLGGVQISGVVSGARHMKGLQVAGVVNSAESMRGLQLGTVNLAEESRGMQLGVVNVTDDGGGFRFGVVNVARRTHGFQFGVVNVAKQDDGESFALVNAIGNGIHDFAVYATDAMLTNVGFKLGGRHLYTELDVGYQPGDALSGTGPDRFGRGTRRWSTGLGIGWRFPLLAGPLQSLDLEAHGQSVNETWKLTGNPPMLNALRVMANVRLAPHVTLLAGVAGNIVVGQEGTDLDLSLGGPEKVIRDGATTVRIYPGFLLGLQI